MSELEKGPLPPEEQAKLIETFVAKDFKSLDELTAGLKELQLQGVEAIVSGNYSLKLSEQIDKVEGMIKTFINSANQELPKSPKGSVNIGVEGLRMIGITRLIANKLAPLLNARLQEQKNK